MTAPAQTAAPSRLADLLPGVVAATSFAISNVLSKIVLTDGADVLTISVFRGVVGVVLVAAWLKIGTPPCRTRRARVGSASGSASFSRAWCIGLFAAFARVSVPVAILSYFVYPLITGLLGVLFGPRADHLARGRSRRSWLLPASH